MERVPTSTEETNEDIDINTSEGLRAFLRYAEDAYSEILEIAKTHANENTHDVLARASEIYDTLKTKFDEAFQVKEDGEHVDEVLTEALQGGYNNLLEILDAPEAGVSAEGVATAEASMENVAEAVRHALSKVEATPIESRSGLGAVSDRGLSQEDTFAKFAETEVVNSFTRDAETVFSEVSRPSEGFVVDEGDEVEASEFLENKEKLELLVERADELVDKYKEIRDIASLDAVLNVGQHYYNQLVATSERAKAALRIVSSKIETHDKITELVEEHMEDILSEIEDNLDQLDKGLSGFFEAEMPIERAVGTPKVSSGSLEVVKTEAVLDSAVKSVPIVLVKKPEPVPPPEPPQKVSAIYNETIRPSAERKERAFGSELGATIEKVLDVPRYKNFVLYTFSSPAHFEAMVRREINRIETPSRFDSILGYKRSSAFHDLLRDMTIKEVAEFDGRQPHGEIVKSDVESRDIEYKIYLDWIDSLDSMLTISHAHPDLTFGEVFVRAELEVLMQHEEQLAA